MRNLISPIEQHRNRPASPLRSCCGCRDRLRARDRHADRRSRRCRAPAISRSATCACVQLPIQSDRGPHHVQQSEPLLRFLDTEPSHAVRSTEQARSLTRDLSDAVLRAPSSSNTNFDDLSHSRGCVVGVIRRPRGLLRRSPAQSAGNRRTCMPHWKNVAGIRKSSSTRSKIRRGRAGAVVERQRNLARSFGPAPYRWAEDRGRSPAHRPCHARDGCARNY